MSGTGAASRPDCRARGQALVEFALVLPVFFLIVLALIDTGKGVYSYNTLAQSAREGARLAAVEASWIGATGGNCTAPVCPADTGVLRVHTLAAVNRMAVAIGPIATGSMFTHCHAAGTDTPASTASWNDCSTSNTAGNVLTVRVTYTYQPIIGAFFRWVTAGTIQITTDATMAIN